MAPRHYFAKRLSQPPAARGQALAIAPHAFGQSFDEDFLTTEQVRQRFGLKSLNAVYRLVREYDLPRECLGGRIYRFKPSAIAAWLEQQKAHGQQPARLVGKGA